MDQHLGLRLAPPDSHRQGLQDDICRLTALHRPADHTPGLEVDDRATDSSNHGEGRGRKNLASPPNGQPHPVWRFDVERPVEASPVQETACLRFLEPVAKPSAYVHRRDFDHDRWLAAIAAGAAAYSRPPPCPPQTGQPGSRAEGFALINQVIIKRAIAVGRAALGPGFVQRLGLAPVLPGLARSLEPAARLRARSAGCAGSDTWPGQKLPPMPGHDRRRHWLEPMAQLARLFQDGAFLGNPCQLPLQGPDLGIRPGLAEYRLCERALPDIERVLARPEPFQNLADRVDPIGEGRAGPPVAAVQIAGNSLTRRRVRWP